MKFESLCLTAVLSATLGVLLIKINLKKKKQQQENTKHCGIHEYAEYSSDTDLKLAKNILSSHLKYAATSSELGHTLRSATLSAASNSVLLSKHNLNWDTVQACCSGGFSWFFL